MNKTFREKLEKIVQKLIEGGKRNSQYYGGFKGIAEVDQILQLIKEEITEIQEKGDYHDPDSITFIGELEEKLEK